MSDVFLSYSRTDRAIAEKLAACLQGEGLTVWWDPQILPGSDYRDMLKQQLEFAQCVVVLWSANSVSSQWVKAEADFAHKKGKFIPVLIEDAEIPFGFGGIEAADLCQVTQFESHPEYVNLLAAIKGKLAPIFPDITARVQSPDTFGSGLGILSGYLKSSGFSAGSRFAEKMMKAGNIDVVFEDNFHANTHGWSEKRDHQTIVMRIKNGKYSIDHRRESGSWYTWLSIPVEKNRDFAIEVEAAHLFSAAQFEKSKVPFYGVNWGGSGFGDLHEIMFSYDGYFSYKKVINDEWIDVIPWKKTYRFKELDDGELRAVNKIEIIKKADVIEFRLNGSWLEDADIDVMAGDNVGFSVHRKLEVEINHVKLTQS